MKKLWLFLRQKLADSSLQAKLMGIIVAMVVVSTLVFFVVTSTIVSQEYRASVLHSASYSFSQAHDFTRQLTWPMLYISDMLAYNSTLQDILDRNVQQLPPLPQQYRDMLTLQSHMQFQKLSQKSLYARLYVTGDLMYAENNINFDSIDNLDPLLYEELLATKERYLWMDPESMALVVNETPRRVVSLLRKIRHSDDYGRTIGIARISIETAHLDDIITKADITKQGVTCIVNSHRAVIASSDGEKLDATGILQPQVFAGLVENTYNWDNFTLDGKEYIVRVEPIEETNWYMIAMIPADEIAAPGRRLASIMVVAMLVIVVFGCASAYYISGRFSQRLRALAKHMVGVRSGKLESIANQSDTDEIGMLYDSFNYMVDEMKDLLAEQYENGVTLKSAELRALQAQINPHFLYNTLDLINWKAMDSGAPQVAEIALSLAQYYKLSLKSGRDIVSIQDEVDHIETYVKIQNYRFENRIQLVVDLPQELLQYAIPKIVLQPLVENSILHGIMKSNQITSGHISIEGRREGEDAIVLSVSDNGCGMPPLQAECILQHDSKTRGYGVFNINQRLQLLYGAGYGLSYLSVLGKGTTVNIRIPAQPLPQCEAQPGGA